MGDTLFAGSIGRTDLPGGDLDLLLSSIRSQFLFIQTRLSCTGDTGLTRRLASSGPRIHFDMTSLFANPSIVGLALKAAAVLMIAIMCLTLVTDRAALVAGRLDCRLGRAARRAHRAFGGVPDAVDRVLSAAVLSLLHIAFAYLMFAGCRSTRPAKLLRPRDSWMALILLLPALALPVMGRWQFNVFYPFHALIYAYLFFCAWRQLAGARPSERGRAGLRVLKAALAILSLAYAIYAPVFAAAAKGWVEQEPAFLAFSPFYDMLMLTLLGFGVVMLTSGEVHSDLEKARDRLAGVAQLDHLTSAFNRHAFYQVLDRDLSGTAVFADIDNLKSINDQFGHAAGDTAIRACATALRSHIRADDLLFRWGGDEFLVCCSGFSEFDARRRLGDVNDLLRDIHLAGTGGTMTVSVSMGFAAFNSAESLDEVIRVADTAMYGHKRQRT